VYATTGASIMRTMYVALEAASAFAPLSVRAAADVANVTASAAPARTSSQLLFPRLVEVLKLSPLP
jgi:hypothetical protein